MKRKFETDWELSIGFYAGILFGLREYNFEHAKMIVLYLPFIDLALTLNYNEVE